MAYNSLLIEQSNNRVTFIDGASGYGQLNESETEGFVLSPTDFLVMRPFETQIRCFAKAHITQIQFRGLEADIDDTYATLVGS